MKKTIVLLILLLCFFNSESQITDTRTGVVIEFEYNENIFPGSWKADPINGKGTTLDKEQEKRSLRIIKKALSKYPVKIIKNNIQKIYILKTIEFYGQGFGATYSNDIVYIANSGIHLGYSDYYIEKSFHHEFSSILLQNYPEYFDKSKWKSNNKIGYGKGGVQALKDSEDEQTIETKYNEKGFLHQYAVSDIENDFNSFAENLFVPTERFWETVDSYPGLGKKLNVIIDFYNSLNGMFTEDHFKTLK